MESQGTGTIKNEAYPKHQEEEETRPNRSNLFESFGPDSCNSCFRNENGVVLPEATIITVGRLFKCLVEDP